MIKQNWGKVIAISLAFAAFLGWYDSVRNKGRLFLCDIASFVGQQEAMSICSKKASPVDDASRMALLEFLKAREGQLAPDRLKQLRKLEAYFENVAFKVLMESAGLNNISVDAQTQADTQEAVGDIIQKGDPEERRALAMIADGKVIDGLALLSELASSAASKNVEQWRRIGRLAYAVDTMQALEAYKKVIVLDKSNTWDSIYLGRLYQQSGSLTKALLVYEGALASLPETDERDRSVLLNEIGDVLKSQGNLAGALDSYRASMDIFSRLAKADPDNAGWQRDLSVAHERIGDVLKSQGNLAGAISAYEKSLPIAQSLADRFPGYPQFQSDVVITTHRLKELRAQAE